MPLTDFAIRKVAPRDKPFRLTDGKGLALQVHPNGGKYWQSRYRFYSPATQKGAISDYTPTYNNAGELTAKIACLEAQTRDRNFDLLTMYGWLLEKFGK